MTHTQEARQMKRILVTLGLFFLIALPAVGFTEIGDVLRGAALFDKNCAVCHGQDARGSGMLAASLPVKPANLTDCRLTAEDPTEVLEGIIREGGSYTGLSTVMPAWGGRLTEQEISDVAAFVKTLCTTKNWLKGDLNFPRPLITGKAFPENEIVVGGKFAQGTTDTSTGSVSVGFRMDGLTNLEVGGSVLRRHLQNDIAHTGIGDASISVKRVLAYNYAKNYLVAAGLKVQFPTGDEDRNLGSGEITWQPSFRTGFRIEDIVTQIDTRITIPAETSDENATARYNLALAYVFQPDPRLEAAPMLEITNETRINGAKDGQTATSLIPQFRFKWLQYSAGFGLEIPVSNRSFDTRALFEITYEHLLF